MVKSLVERINFRDVLAVIYTFLFPAVILILIWAAYEFTTSVLEALGIGTIIGILSKCFSDMWQFYFRKKPSESDNDKD